MSRKRITDHQKNHVVMFSTSTHREYSQYEIADIVGIHRKSVYRIQKENGLLKQTVELSDEDYLLFQAVKAAKMPIKKAFNKLLTSPERLAINYLNSLSKKELAVLYYNHVFKKAPAYAKETKHAVG